MTRGSSALVGLGLAALLLLVSGPRTAAREGARRQLEGQAGMDASQVAKETMTVCWLSGM